jgi:hypothetical protein
MMRALNIDGIAIIPILDHKEKSEKQGYDEKEFSFLMKQA